MISEILSPLIEKHLVALGYDVGVAIQLEKPKLAEHGDLSSNVAMLLAKPLKKAPLAIAQALQESLSQETLFRQVEVKAPGFLNFFLKPELYWQALAKFYEKQTLHLPAPHAGERVMVEFVSANPTGPMHVGHGRNAVVGDCLARLLEAVGYDVFREFYVNDHGVQIKTLGLSGKYYLQKLDAPEAELEDLGQDVYRGAYVEELVAEHAAEIRGLIDDSIRLGKRLGQELLKKVVQDLQDIGVVFNRYSHESSLYEQGKIEETLTLLKNSGNTYEEGEALWFASTRYGDDKDRVLIKNDGSYTYFTPDIAYHRGKFEQNFALYLNVMGADHAGYVPRMKAAMAALGFDAGKLEFLLMQMVSLKRGGETVSMSKRSGDYVTLREVIDEVGSDAARFFFMMRSHKVTLEFDLELARSQSMDNPVYYLQYAHARICSIFEKVNETGFSLPESVDLSALKLPEEIDLIKTLLDYPTLLELAAKEREPHRVGFYLLDLAKLFQNYYTQGKTNSEYRFLGGAEATMAAKLFLLKAIQAVLRSGFGILGISAPEKM